MLRIQSECPEIKDSPAHVPVAEWAAAPFLHPGSVWPTARHVPPGPLQPWCGNLWWLGSLFHFQKPAGEVTTLSDTVICGAGSLAHRQVESALACWQKLHPSSLVTIHATHSKPRSTLNPESHAVCPAVVSLSPSCPEVPCEWSLPTRRAVSLTARRPQQAGGRPCNLLRSLEHSEVMWTKPTCPVDSFC